MCFSIFIFPFPHYFQLFYVNLLGELSSLEFMFSATVYRKADCNNKNNDLTAI